MSSSSMASIELTLNHPLPQSTTNANLIASRLNSSCTRLGDAAYLFGGFDLYSGEVFNELFMISLEDRMWKRIDHIKGKWPSQRHSHSVNVWNITKLVIFGGSDAEDAHLNDIYILDLPTLTWESPHVTGHIPAPRMRHSTVIHKSKLYVTGGQTTGDVVLDVLNILDLETFVWEVPIPFESRISHFSWIFNRRLYLFGGQDENSERLTHLTYIDLADKSRTKLTITSEEAPQPLGQHFMQICGDRLIVAVAEGLQHGREAKEVRTGVWSLELNSVRWRRHDEITLLQNATWYYYAMGQDDSRFILFGAENPQSDEFLGMVLGINLETFGIYRVPGSDLGMDFAPLLERRELSDFSITAKDSPEKPIHVHRLVLQARWPYFANLCRSEMQEAREAQLVLPEPYGSVHGFVRYLYTDSIEGLSPDDLAGLLGLANCYCMERLQKMCCDILHREINLKNVCHIFEAACKAGETGLSERALAFILDNFGLVSRTKGFRTMQPHAMEELWNRIPEDSQITNKSPKLDEAMLASAQPSDSQNEDGEGGAETDGDVADGNEDDDEYDELANGTEPEDDED
ncbi:uncharacterized protein BJ171DRAFT_490973 [Polychytrium aggregatum]|uniref:uncharacterized protein n=1 Tax=Polychytrium aggregatum TaxID=110093 RepID=UPI0022FE9C7D|nr:uncharacterized protein BJ171DRAFT_490973 [Polychytrium aggregatum]KAI9208332.1 hypothetical protein BJ171DRAFT_490973 [Polychytrium aggregatum]